MVAVSVAWNGTRIDAADGNSNTSNIGGGAGAGAEPDILYQGSGATPEEVSRKIGTGAGGFSIDTAMTDISTATGTYQTLVMKYAAGNWAALELLSVPGMEARIGSGTNAYAQYDFVGGDNYPEKGGFVFLCADPNIAGYRTATSGSPAFASADYFGIVGDFTATSKSENLVHSAIDIGDGYTVTGGGGADPTANYSDVASFNSTLANRHGFFFALEGEDGAFGQYGTVVWGSSATAVDYQDESSPTVFLLDGFYEAGWSGLEDNVENASTVIAPVGGAFISRGNTTTTDTRSVYNVTGSTATFSRTGQRFINFAQFNCGSTGTYDTCDIQSADFGHNTATLTNCTLRSTAAVNVAMTNDFTVDDTSGLTVAQEGAGHFVDYGTINTQTINWTVTTQGFPVGTTGLNTDTSNGNETILCSVNSGQTLTINVAAGATIPSVKNDGVGDVNIVAGQVTLTITAQDINTGAPIEGARVLVEAAAGGGLAAGTVIIDKALTDVSGQTSDTRSYSGNQPITGRIRRGTSSPLYQTAPITGTINSTSGLSLTISMISDE